MGLDDVLHKTMGALKGKPGVIISEGECWCEEIDGGLTVCWWKFSCTASSGEAFVIRSSLSLQRVPLTCFDF